MNSFDYRHDSYINDNQRILDNIFHELRTPLTRIQLTTALMRRRQGDDYALRIDTEVHRLNSILLEISRSNNPERPREVLKTNHLWANVISDAQFEAEQMGKSLEFTSLPGNWTIIGDAFALNSALENIVRNAIRYSHHRILVGFSTDQYRITITVDDDGPGVSKDDREQIFRPFYRTSQAKDRDSSGTTGGLGLAIVETAVIQHGGWVKATDSPLGGLQLIICLPQT